MQEDAGVVSGWCDCLTLKYKGLSVAKRKKPRHIAGAFEVLETLLYLRKWSR